MCHEGHLFHGFSWLQVSFHSFSWFQDDFHWFYMVPGWFSMVPGPFSLFFMIFIYNRKVLFVTFLLIPAQPRSVFMVFYGSSLVFHGLG